MLPSAPDARAATPDFHPQLLALVTIRTPCAEQRTHLVPVQLPDHTDGREATDEYLEQHAAGTGVKVRIDWRFEEEPPHQHEKRQRKILFHSMLQFDSALDTRRNTRPAGCAYLARTYLHHRVSILLSVPGRTRRSAFHSQI